MSEARRAERFFRENGYVTFPGFLDADAIRRGQRIVEDSIQQSRELEVSNAVLDIEQDHTRHNPRLRRIKNAADVHPFFGNVVRREEVLDIAERLLGAPVRFRRSQLNIKTPGRGTAVEWHQDFAFEPHTNSDILSIGVAFQDSTQETGCLYVVPGSHLLGVLDHWDGERFVGAVPVNDSAIDFSSAVPIVLSAGDIWVHHGLVLHGSGHNTTDHHARSTLLIDYSAADAWPLYQSKPDIGELRKSVVRGQWSGAVRLTPMTFRIPPASTSKVTTYDVQEQVQEKAFA